jgi:putative chitobiose transport system substrate-binding protein
MRTKLFVLLLVVSILLAACAPTPAAPVAEPETIIETVVVETVKTVEVEKPVEVEVLITPTPGPNPEAVIQGVEEGAEITFWTFWLSPTFDDYIKSTLDRFQAAYPGVTVNWEDHQATFQDDLRNAFAAGSAPDVINLSISEGWVSDYATQGLLLPLDDVVPQEVVDLYFPNLWDLGPAGGRRPTLPVPLVPGHPGRADQPADLRPDRAGDRRFPDDYRRPARAVPDN